MHEIYSWITVSLLLSGTGMLLALKKALSSRKKLIDAVPFDKSVETPQGEVEARRYYSNVSLVMSALALTSFIYTVLISILILIFGIPNDAVMRVAIGALLAVSISSFFTNLGRYLIYEETILGMNEFGEGSKENFGRHMVFLTIFETTAIYGLLIGELGMVLSGMLGGTIEGLTVAEANTFLTAGIVVGISGLATILSARSFNRIEGPINKEDGLFVKKLKALVIPHSINLIGLAIAIVLIYQSLLTG